MIEHQNADACRIHVFGLESFVRTEDKICFLIGGSGGCLSGSSNSTDFDQSHEIPANRKDA